MDTEVEFRPIAERRLSFQKPDAPITRTPSIKRVESYVNPTAANAVPQWLQELKRKKKVNGDGTETTKTNSPASVTSDPPVSKSEIKQEPTKNTPEEKPSSSCVVSDAKSDYSARARKISNVRNKPQEIRPTLTELQKGAEKINNTIAELQRDMQILLEQLKQAQVE